MTPNVFEACLSRREVLIVLSFRSFTRARQRLQQRKKAGVEGLSNAAVRNIMYVDIDVILTVYHCSDKHSPRWIDDTTQTSRGQDRRQVP